MMQSQWLSRVSAGVAFLGVALGAFGAHALKTSLAAREMTAVWEKAVFYHLIHAVVLWGLAARTGAPARFRAFSWSLFASGILLFSGSLYLLALTEIKAFGPLTPLGGLCLLAGWLSLALAPVKNPD